MPGPRRRPIILLAHPDAGVRSRLGLPLADAGLEVMEVAGVQAAIEHAVAVVPDVVVLNADDADLEPARAISAVHSDEHLLDVPIVLLSEGADAMAVIEGLAAGAHDLLRTTSDAAEVVARIEAALVVRRLYAEVRLRAQELATVARVDGLTNLATRRHAEEHLQMASSSARRQGHRVAVVLIDVDHLRRVNSDLTREAGDAVLREVSRRIGRALRTDDIAGRWGGEEFLLVLPATELAGAWTVADRIRRFVAETPISVPGGEVLVTVSGGCADGDGADMDDVLRRAESALDAAKQAGRNRILTDPTSAA